jgi:hypothetical protein
MPAAGTQRPAALTELGQSTLRRLMRESFEFEKALAAVPIIRRLDLGTFSRGDYQNWLLNLRPQVVEVPMTSTATSKCWRPTTWPLAEAWRSSGHSPGMRVRRHCIRS